MLRPDCEKWGQTVSDLQKLAVDAEHRRSRERFQALFQIGSKQTNATRWAGEIGRDRQTVMEWVHKYNAEGPTAVLYRHSGGRPPFLPPNRKQK